MSEIPARRNTDPPLKQTPLHDLHKELGARLVPFAGYELPVQYPGGIIKEHRHTRAAAGLFDVSHMGQLVLRGGNAAAALETLVPGDILGLATGRLRYTQFTNAKGGILDDLVVGRAEDHLTLVVNAACKDSDLAHLRDRLPQGLALEVLEDRALLALQGPMASAVLKRLSPAPVDAMPFMSFAAVEIAGIPCVLSRSGYTGEDGYEISLAAERAGALARRLLAEPEVEPAGLGARDSLRLEAGLCLYGHDIDGTTTPVEARLGWSIGRRRRAEGGFPGAEVIRRQLADGPPRLRVGLRPEGRAPVREGTELVDEEGTVVGRVTSGGFGPSVGAPVAMGYVEARRVAPGTSLQAIVRGRAMPVRLVDLPFVEHRYYRG